MEKITWCVIQPLNGGMAIGFEQELGNPKYVISNNDKNDTHYLEYVKKRELDVPIVKMDWDLKEFDEERSEISKEEFEKIKEVDIVCAVPVCAGLSMLNAQKACPDKECDMGRGNPENVQNQNMYNVTRFTLNTIKPKVYVFENAPTAYSNLGKGVLEKLREIAKEAGYSVTIEKVNTYNHGIPQARQRTFVYFFKDENAYILKMEHTETPTLEKFFETFISKDATQQDEYAAEKEDNRDLSWQYIDEKYAKPKGKTVVEFTRELVNKDLNVFSTMRVIEELNDFDGLIEYIEEKVQEEKDEAEKKKKENYLRKVKHIKSKLADGKGYWDISNLFCLNGKAINALISKSASFIVHPNCKRGLTKRECLALMGMPNDYELHSKAFVPMVTQSVPVNTARHAAMNCRLFVEGKLQKANTNFVKQNNIKKTIDLGEPLIQENLDEW